MCGDLRCDGLISVAFLPVLLRLVAHANARLDVKITAAAINLITPIDIRPTLSAYLFFPFAFI
jgi:hypothetical protein